MKGNWFTLLLEEFREVLLPSRCVLCGVYGSGTICPLCLKGIESMIKPLREEKLKTLSLFSYEGRVRELVHLLKYRGFYEIGVILGMIMGKHCRDLVNSSFDGVIPVPLHRKELRERGYNQVEALAKGFLKEHPLPYLNRCLVKVKETQPQVGLSSAERKKNVRDAFSACPDVKGKMVLLLDDVFTTGETVRSCRQALKLKGAVSVETFTLCRQL